MERIFVRGSIRFFLNPLLCFAAPHAPQLYPLLLFIATQERPKAQNLDFVFCLRYAKNPKPGIIWIIKEYSFLTDIKSDPGLPPRNRPSNHRVAVDS